MESDDTVPKVVAGSSKIDAEQELNQENDDDILWKLQRYMHDPLKWRLYDTCAIHYVFIERGHDIFMLVEKDYPLTRALMTLMLSNKLQVDEYSTSRTHEEEAGSSQSKRPRQHEIVEELLLPQVHYEVRKAESEEEVFTSVAWIRAFNINEPIYAEFYHEFYSTYEFDETLLEFARRLGLYQAVELEEAGFNVYFEGGMRNDDNFNAPGIKVQKNDLWLLDLIDSDGKLIPEDPHLGVPRVGIPRPPRASMQDLYDMMGRIEIHQDTIEWI
ncbi:hypothetical protein Tco_0111565 [Tanacetum coccineum]